MGPVKSATVCVEAVNKLCSEFGLTPAARTRTQVHTSTDDPMEEHAGLLYLLPPHVGAER